VIHRTLRRVHDLWLLPSVYCNGSGRRHFTLRENKIICIKLKTYLIYFGSDRRISNFKADHIFYIVFDQTASLVSHNNKAKFCPPKRQKKDYNREDLPVVSDK
jgi:hypothetical protein